METMIQDDTKMESLPRSVLLKPLRSNGSGSSEQVTVRGDSDKNLRKRAAIESPISSANGVSSSDDFHSGKGVGITPAFPEGFEELAMDRISLGGVNPRDDFMHNDIEMDVLARHINYGRQDVPAFENMDDIDLNEFPEWNPNSLGHGGHQGFGQLGSGFDDQNDDFLAEEALMMLEEDISDIPNPPMTSSQQKMMRPGYHRESSSKQISQMIATLTPDVKKGLHDILQRAESGKSSDSGQEAFQEALNYLSQTARSDSNMRMDIERPQDLLLDLHSNHSSLNSETMQALIDVVMDTSGNEGTSAKSGKSDGSLDSVTRRMLFELASNPSMLEPDYNPIHSNSTIDSYYSYCQSLSGPSSALYYSSNSSNNNPQFDFNSTDDNNHNNGNNSNNKKANKNNKEKESKEKARGSYRCGRCGLPKVNHVCQVVEAASHSVSVQASNSTAIVDTSSGMPTPFTGEKFISVGGGNRNKNPSFVDRSSPSLASSSSLMDIAPDDASTISFGVYNNNASGATMSPFYSADSDSSKRMEGVTEEAMDEDDQEEESKKRQSSYFCSVDREQADTQCFPFFCF